MRKKIKVLLGSLLLSSLVVANAFATVPHVGYIDSANNLAVSKMKNDRSTTRYCENYIFKTDSNGNNVSILKSATKTLASNAINEISVAENSAAHMAGKASIYRAGSYNSGLEDSSKIVIK